MTEDEFVPEIMKLYRGHNAERFLTPEKIGALYSGLKRFSLSAIRHSVTTALREPRIPSFDKLAKFAGDFEEYVRRKQQAEQRARDERARDQDDEEPLRTWAPGEWVRVHGLGWLWPPAYLSEESLASIGWPWPEWPTSWAEARWMKEPRG